MRPIPSERPVQKIESSEWPRGLRKLSRPLAGLFVRGSIGAGPRIAIVGTRRADPPAIRFTVSLAAAAANAGVTVVSGGAFGIDAAAHRGALDAGGRTIAVLAGGVMHAYPTRHAALFAQIIESGAVVSEHLDVPTHPGRFLARNRVIAALAEQVVVVQAPIRSGALSTAKHARVLGREVYAVPSAPWDARGEGSLGLLVRGASLLRDPQELFPTTKGTRRRERTPPRDPTAARVFAALGAEPTHPDELAVTTCVPLRQVHLALFDLVVDGHAEEREGGRFTRVE